jgi:hypothetical protein
MRYKRNLQICARRREISPVITPHPLFQKGGIQWHLTTRSAAVVLSMLAALCAIGGDVNLVGAGRLKVVARRRYRSTRTDRVQ